MKSVTSRGELRLPERHGMASFKDNGHPMKKVWEERKVCEEVRKFCHSKTDISDSK